METSIGSFVRKSQNDYTQGVTTQSKYVQFQMHDTIEKVDAYANSKHISGTTDAKGRKKPFFNISIAAVNVWYRATDINRSQIKIRANKSKDWIDSFLGTVVLRDWMNRERFGQFLNDWGRVLARYGSAVIKFVENSNGLHIQVVRWSTLIVDQVNFYGNPVTEMIELTEAELKKRIQTHGYRADMVKALIEAEETARETLDKRKKDNRPDYFKIYEVHGEFPLSYLTFNEDDEETYVQQMHVISFVGVKEGRNIKNSDFTLYSGREAQSPYMITHLIKEEDRTLAKGAIESLFEAQWIVNDSMKKVKDVLELSTRLMFQTADSSFVGRNVLDDMMDGDILIHSPNFALTKVENSKTDVVGLQNYAVQWKSLGNEITGISEAMLGIAPKSGEAWHQTQALLTESYSLFKVMTENKGLDIEEMLRTRIIPYLKRTKLDTSKEIAAILDQNDIDKIDGIYIKNEAINRTNRQTIKMILAGHDVTPDEQAQLLAQNEGAISEAQKSLGAQRFFKPSDLDDRTWKEQLKDLEWEVEVDVTGESFDVKEALTTLDTALKTIVTPGFEQNKRAQAVVGKILELTKVMSPLEYFAIPVAPLAVPPPTQAPTQQGSTVGAA